MTNRPSSFPILITLALSLVASPQLALKAEPGVPDATTAPSSNAPTTPEAAPAAAPAATTAPAPTPAPAPAPAASDASADRPATYTITTGDSLWKVAHKFGTTVVKLRKLNNLKKGALLHPGQVLQIPPATSTDTTAPASAAPKPDASATTPKPGVAVHHKKIQATDPEIASSLRAQAVQNFDVSSSTPALVATQTASPPASTPVIAADTPAPRAELVSPAELSAASSANSNPTEETAPSTESTASTFSSKHSLTSHGTDSGDVSFPEPPPLPPEQKLTSRGPNPLFTTPANDWANRFMQVAQDLADKDIDYDEDWRPPGESHAWTMDCSNTARYIYKVATGIALPRTASDQYYYLHLQNKAWDVPQAANGFADCAFLRENLKPGDLLFWENTYRPERQPPITHVMVYLGTNDKGQWLMVGSQTSRGGLHNRRHGGPDIYVFDPTKPSGGYSTWLGLVHHKGRFCAYGRPLEADKTKLAVATND